MNRLVKYFTLFTQFFLFMVVPIAGCSLLGWWIDQKAGTSFWVIVFFFLGALSGMTNIIKLAMKMTQSGRKDNNHENRDS